MATAYTLLDKKTLVARYRHTIEGVIQDMYLEGIFDPLMVHSNSQRERSITHMIEGMTPGSSLDFADRPGTATHTLFKHAEQAAIQYVVQGTAA